MAKLCKDISDDIAAEAALLEFTSAKELQAFMKGEQREFLLDKAAFRMNHLKQPKQGEQTGPITQTTADFKGGVQGTKGSDDTSSIVPRDASLGSITGQDIVGAIDERDEKLAIEAAVRTASSGSSEDKSAAQVRKERGIVSGEDVVAKLRAEGKAI